MTACLNEKRHALAATRSPLLPNPSLSLSLSLSPSLSLSLFLSVSLSLSLSVFLSFFGSFLHFTFFLSVPVPLSLHHRWLVIGKSSDYKAGGFFSSLFLLYPLLCCSFASLSLSLCLYLCLSAGVLCLPVQEGGHGLMDIERRNTAFRLQAGYRLPVVGLWTLEKGSWT